MVIVMEQAATEEQVQRVIETLVEVGYDDWVFVEHDTHLQDPLLDLAISRAYLRNAGF